MSLDDARKKLTRAQIERLIERMSKSDKEKVIASLEGRMINLTLQGKTKAAESVKNQIDYCRKHSGWVTQW